MSKQPCVREIVHAGQPVIHQVAAGVDDVRSPAIQELIVDLIATFDCSGMVGLSALQIGSPLRIIILTSRPIRGHPVAPVPLVGY